MNYFASLPDELSQALTSLQFVDPTPIQKAVFGIINENHDLIACAETGSGKTGAFAIPVVEQLLKAPEKKALILVPTRELAQQIFDFTKKLISYSNLRAIAVYGGTDMRKQQRALKSGPAIIIATPGRLIDLLRTRSLDLNSVGVLVLDEGDRMLDMGFIPQLNEILKYLPKERQTMLFTATMSSKVQALAQKYLRTPKNVSVGKTSQPVSAIRQSVLQMKSNEKDNKLIDELNRRAGSVIVFTRTQRRTDIIAQLLTEYGFPVGLIHGGLSQGQRNRALTQFRSGSSRILCATDIAARGIDVPHVEHVINFDLPMMEEDYVHRIGRTARNGNRGEAVSFVTPEEHGFWHKLVRKYDIPNAQLEITSHPGRKKKNGGSKSRPRFRSR